MTSAMPSRTEIGDRPSLVEGDQAQGLVLSGLDHR
jgi:hypothetical protein